MIDDETILHTFIRTFKWNLFIGDLTRTMDLFLVESANPHQYTYYIPLVVVYLCIYLCVCLFACLSRMDIHEPAGKVSNVDVDEFAGQNGLDQQCYEVALVGTMM